MKRLKKSSLYHHKKYPSLFYRSGQIKDPVVVEILKSNKPPPKKIPLPNIGIPGINRIFDSKCNIWVRFVWLVILVTTTGGCFYQIFLRFGVYLDYPIMKNTRIVPNPTITFPFIIICPSYVRTSFYSLLHSRNKTCQQNPSIDCVSDIDAKYVVDGANFSWTKETPEDIWRTKYYIPSESIQVYEPCSASNSSITCDPRYGQEIPVTAKNLSTFWGRCLVLSTNVTLAYRGIFTHLKIRYRDILMENWIKQKNLSSELLDRNKTLSILFYVRDQVFNKHEAFYLAQDTLHGFNTDVRIDMTKFTYKSTSKSRCVNPKQNFKCLRHCFDFAMEKALNCRMPFMESNLTQCRLSGVYEIYRKAYLVYSGMNVSSCDCHKSCEEITYNLIYDVTDRIRDGSSVVLKFYFNDNTYEYVKEDFAYTKSALLSDIGGSLGFFLGFCCLTLAELLEYFCQRIKANCARIQYVVKKMAFRRNLRKRLASSKFLRYRKN